MPKHASAIPSETSGELERLSALETLKGLQNPESVTLGDLVRYLDSRGLWRQFAKITLGDLRDGFTQPANQPERTRKRKRRILEDELDDAYAAKASASDNAGNGKAKADDKPENDGGMTTDEFWRLIMPFIEGNGDVTLDDIEDYTRLERKVLRHHLGILVKDGRLERIGTGKHAVYSAL